MRAFKRRYVSFKDLLQSNADLANTLASIDAALHGDASYNENQVRAAATTSIFHAMRMVTCLNALAGNRYPTLVPVVEAINTRIMAELDEKTAAVARELTLPLAQVTAADTPVVGGKSANLGELRNAASMPVPRGFAVTTAAHTLFMGKELMDEVRKMLRNADPAHPATVVEVSGSIEALILAAAMPPALEQALLEQWDATFGPDDAGQSVLAALRSSAVAEDGSLTFAGQYRTVLGVRRETLCHAFRQVTASLFSPRAITYCLSNGYICEDMVMPMCCLEMVDAVAAGVAFSRHPVELTSEAVVVNGLWGLGELLVDGEATPDQWLVSRGDNAIVATSTAYKDVALRLHVTADAVETKRRDVPESLRKQPCLTEAQVRSIADMALRLERHYLHPQDVEWAVDGAGKILLLQSRPMRMPDSAEQGQRGPAIPGAVVLLEGGDIAAKGVGCGPVYHVDSESDMENFPAGAVLVTRHSSPNMVVVMERAAAVLAETGSLTGHMASVCREFHLPTLLNIKGILELSQGQVVTVDALSSRVYAGEVPELPARRIASATRKTPVQAMLQRVAQHISPLHLIDAKSAMFTPEHCTSLHDVMRFVHEQSYSEMFQLSDSASDAGAVASHLRCPVPLDLYVIDLGEGLKDPSARTVYPEDVLSIPFRRLLDGMLAPEVQAREPRPVDMQGFLSVMSQSMIGGNRQGGERFGDRSYAIISDRYCNFSSRVGYHYAVLDAWCGDTMNKNYVSFKFAGGAADGVRRNRRVRCIGLILKALGFHVDVVMDRVQARFQKYPRPEIEARLEQLGRLLIITRQMDMLMVSEESVQIFADKFLRGEYH